MLHSYFIYVVTYIGSYDPQQHAEADCGYLISGSISLSNIFDHPFFQY